MGGGGAGAQDSGCSSGADPPCAQPGASCEAAAAAPTPPPPPLPWQAGAAALQAGGGRLQYELV